MIFAGPGASNWLSLLFISSGTQTDPSRRVAPRFFTAKEARCFPETAFGFVRLPSASLSALPEVRRVHGDPGGVFIATREPSNRTRRCSGRAPLVPMMEPADLWKRQDLSGAAGLNGVRLGVEATDLIRDADRKPADEILDSRLRHKAGIVDLITPEDDWTTEDWREFFDERASSAWLRGSSRFASIKRIASSSFGWWMPSRTPTGIRW